MAKAKTTPPVSSKARSPAVPLDAPPVVAPPEPEPELEPEPKEAAPEPEPELPPPPAPRPLPPRPSPARRLGGPRAKKKARPHALERFLQSLDRVLG